MDWTGQLIHTRTVRRRMSLKLATWAGVSMVFALVVFATQPLIPAGAARSLIQAIGAQFLLWGLLDAGFAMFGLRQAQQADRAGTSPAVIDRELSDREKLVRLLRFSNKVNIVMMCLGIGMIAGGVALAHPTLVGHGIGVLVQGGFLRFFDRAFLKSFTDAPASSFAR
jgi:hypothetical protein